MAKKAKKATGKSKCDKCANFKPKKAKIYGDPMVELG